MYLFVVMMKRRTIMTVEVSAVLLMCDSSRTLNSNSLRESLLFPFKDAKGKSSDLFKDIG